MTRRTEKIGLEWARREVRRQDEARLLGGSRRRRPPPLSGAGRTMAA